MEGDGHLCILNTVYIEYCFFDVVLYCVISFFLLHYSAAKKFQIDSIKSKEWKREGNTRTQSLPLAWLLSSHNQPHTTTHFTHFGYRKHQSIKRVIKRQKVQIKSYNSFLNKTLYITSKACKSLFDKHKHSSHYIVSQ